MFRLLLLSIGMLIAGAALGDDPIPHFPDAQTLTLGDIQMGYVPADPQIGSASTFYGTGGQQSLHDPNDPDPLTGRYNLGVGTRALTNITTGSYNTCGGFESCERATTNKWNTCWGEACLIYNVMGNGNTALGWKALLGRVDTAGPGHFNIAIGFATAMNLTGGSSNIIAGNSAMHGNDLNGADPSGSYNVVIGDLAGYDMTTATRNMFVGANAGRNVTTGNYNVLVNCTAAQAGMQPNSSNKVAICDGMGKLRLKIDGDALIFYKLNGTPVQIIP